MSRKRIKTSKTKFPYEVEYGGYRILVPVGTTVSNKTAGGPDDSYRFVVNTAQLASEVTGVPHSMLAHDLNYRGLNIPAEFCEPYEAEPVYVPAPGCVLLMRSPSHVSDDYPQWATIVLRMDVNEDAENICIRGAEKAAEELERLAGERLAEPDEFLMLAALPKGTQVRLWDDMRGFVEV